MLGTLKKIFGDGNTRQLKRLEKIADDIDAMESDIEKLSEEDLKNKTAEFKERYQNGEKLDDMLVEAFAVVREASKTCVEYAPVPRAADGCDCPS